MYDTTKEIDFTRFVRALIRYRKLGIIIATVVVCIAVFANPVFFPDIYEAKTTVRFQTIAFEDARLNRVSILREEVLGRGVLLEVIKDLNLINTDQTQQTAIQRVLDLFGVKTKRREPNTDAIIRWLSTSVIIEQAQTHGQSDMFVISLTDEDPQGTADIVNAIADRYIESKQRYKNASLSSTVSFLRKQLKAKEKEMFIAEKKLKLFKDHNADLIARAEDLAPSLQVAKNNLITAQSRLREVEVQLVNTKDQLATESPTIVSAETGAVDDENLSPEELYYKTKAELESSRFRYSDSHPMIRRLENKLDRLERQVGKDPIVKTSTAANANPEYRRLRSEIALLEGTKAAAVQEVRLFKEEVNKLQQELLKSPTLMSVLSRLEGRVQELHDEYEAISARLSDSEITFNASETEQIGNLFTVVDRATAPTVTVFGSRMKYYIMGLVLAGIFSLGVIFGIVVLRNVSTEQLNAEIAQRQVSVVGDVLFYASITLVILAVVGYIVFETISQTIVFV